MIGLPFSRFKGWASWHDRRYRQIASADCAEDLCADHRATPAALTPAASSADPAAVVTVIEVRDRMRDRMWRLRGA
jgi:hypothetical protein